MNTHYGVVVFSGDPDGEHDDPDLNGHSPSIMLICSGSKQFCWDSMTTWTAKHPLRKWEYVEVLAKDSQVVGADWKAIAEQYAKAVGRYLGSEQQQGVGDEITWQLMLAHETYEAAIQYDYAKYDDEQSEQE